MAKKAKKKTAKTSPETLTESTAFKKDDETDAYEKNALLAQYLDGAWADLNVVCIERIEIGEDKGWRVHYRP